jgi:uncharacterized protein (TIGR01777 family)
MAQRVVVAGGSGFLGRALVPHLIGRGYDVWVLSRSAGNGDVNTVTWDGKTLGDWCAALEGAAAVINLTGKSVNCRYNAANRNEILRSRLDSVHVLGDAIANCTSPPRVLIQAASLAIYGDAGEQLCDETFPAGGGFSPGVCVQWEKAVQSLNLNATRKVILRISFTLGKEGGALGTLSKLARCFAGGAVGSGRQYISWIHIDDLTAMFQRAIEHPATTGVYNATSPVAVTNGDFMRAVRKAVGRPWTPPTPAFLVKIGAFLMDTDASLALTGRLGVPRRLMKEGFSFHFPELTLAMNDIFGHP